MKQYYYLIVGAGLYGAVFAHEAKKAGKRCLVLDKRGHIAGNIYTEPVEGLWLLHQHTVRELVLASTVRCTEPLCRGGPTLL